MSAPIDTPESIKADLLAFWYKVLDRRLQFIGEGLEHWKRSGHPNVRWGDSLMALRQRVDTRFRELYEIPSLLDRVNRLPPAESAHHQSGS
jgi:hypothetical protein